MKLYIVVSLFLMLVPGTAPAGTVYDFPVHYALEQYQEAQNEPAQLNREQLDRVIVKVPTWPSNFIGFTDSAGTILQFYVLSREAITVEIPSPDDRASYANTITPRKYREIIDNLAEPFVRYKESLGLSLQPW